jgi:hypothetical protein
MPLQLLLAAISCLLLLDTAVCLWIGWRGRRFLAAIPRLECDADLEQYRQLIHQCMYASLAFLVLLVTSFVTPVVLMILNWLRPTDFDTLLAFGVIRVFAAAVVTINVEGQLKAIPTANAELAAARDDLVRMWDGQMLPTAHPRLNDTVSEWLPRDKA